IAAVGVGGIARQRAAPLHRFAAAGENRHAVEALLPVPDGVVAGGADGERGEVLLLGLELLQADDVGTRFVEPAQQDRQPGSNPVDVEGGDAQWSRALRGPTESLVGWPAKA